MGVTITDLTADPLNQTDPFRSNAGMIYFENLPSGSNWSTGGLLSGAGNSLNFAVDTTSLPKESQGIIELATGNERRKYAGNITYDDLTMTFKSLMGVDTYGLLKAWRKKVHDPTTGKTFVAANYKRNGLLMVYGAAPVSGSTHVVQMFKIQGAFPTSLDAGELDKSGEDYLRVNVTFAIDKFFYEYDSSTTTVPAWPTIPG